MALLESTTVPLGTTMPKFELRNPDGVLYKSDELYGDSGLIVAFTCNHCPYALAVWPRLIRLVQYVCELGVNIVAINPNINPAYPDDSPEKMKIKIKQWNLDFPYLVDDTQNVARIFHAQCTPDIYVYNHKKELVYHGRIDDNWKDETAVTREELKEAIELMTAGVPLSGAQHPAMGCSIKWLS